MSISVIHRDNGSLLSNMCVKSDVISGFRMHWGAYVERQKEPENGDRGEVTEFGAIGEARVLAARKIGRFGGEKTSEARAHKHQQKI